MKSDFIANMEKDLWEIYDTFRGEVAVNEVKHYLLSMISLKYLSENNDHPFEILYDSWWGQVTKNGIDIGKRFDRVFSDIEIENNSLKGIWKIKKFSKISDKALFYVADSVLNKYSFKRKEMADQNPLTGTMAQYIESLLEVMIQKEGGEGGEFSSPKEVGELLVRLLGIKDGDVYDGASGLNDFLIESYKNALKNGRQVRLYGQEINPEIWSLGKMNLILHGLYNPDDADIKLGHTITDPIWRTEKNELMQFDMVLSSPPFGIGNWGYNEATNDLFGRFRYGIPPKSSADLAFVQHFSTSLNDQGRAALIVPHGALFRGASEERIREGLVEDDLIEAVIGLPPNLFNGTGIPVAILIINKNKVRDLKKKIFIINAEDGFDKQRVKNKLRPEDIEKIVNTYLNIKEVEEYSKLVDIKDVRRNDWNLLPIRYFDKVEIETDFGNVKVNRNKYQELATVNLEDIADVKRGFTPLKDDMTDDNPSHYLINLSNVDKDGNIIFDSLTGVNISPNKAKGYELEPGDVLLTSRGTLFRVTVIPNTDIPLLFSQNFARIRLFDTERYSPYFIKIFLESPIGQYYVKAFQTGSAQMVLSTKDILSISIPKLSLDQQREVSDQILRSDREYEKAIEAARRNREEGYLSGYQLMGITDSFEIVKKED